MIRPNRQKKHLTYTLVEIYRIYVEERSDWPNLPSKEQWMQVAKKLLLELNLLIFKENIVFRIPGRMGKIGIRKMKNSKRRKVDWKSTNKTGILTYHLNRHTDWYYFQWHWDRRRMSNCMFTNKSMYSFKPTDDKIRRVVGRRGLAAWIQELSQDPYRKDYDCLEFWI